MSLSAVELTELLWEELQPLGCVLIEDLEPVIRAYPLAGEIFLTYLKHGLLRLGEDFETGETYLARDRMDYQTFMNTAYAARCAAMGIDTETA